MLGASAEFLHSPRLFELHDSLRHTDPVLNQYLKAHWLNQGPETALGYQDSIDA